jgi:hypothetical protein
LGNDFSGEIDFVVRRPDTGTQLGDEIFGITSKFLRHTKNRPPNDIERGPSLPGMYESDSSPPRIDQKNSTAVGNIDTQKDVAIASDDRVDPRTFGRRSGRHHSHFVAMNLFSQPGLAWKKSSSEALVIRVQPAKSGRSIASDIEAGDS